MELDVQQLAGEGAASALLGAAIGGIVGYGTKKLGRTLAIIVGVELVVFRFLQSKGVLIVDWDRLTSGLIETRAQIEDPGWALPLLSTLSIGVGFTAGFLVGFRRG